MSCGEEPPPQVKNECGGYYCSEEHGHIDCAHAKAMMQQCQCATPGLTMDGVEFFQVPNHGKPCWKATAQIGSIFGSEVQGQCEGYGETKEKALEALREDQRKLYESIWI